MSVRIYIILVIQCLISRIGEAQSDSTGSASKINYATPGVINSPRSKFLEVVYERVGSSNVTSTTRDSEKALGLPGQLVQESTLRRNNRFILKAKFPILNKETLKIIGGFRYQFEEFQFDTVPNEFRLYNAVFNNLENKHLQSIGGNIYVLKALNEIHYLGVRVSADVNGDYNYKGKELPLKDYFRTSFSAIYGWKKRPNKTTGLGFSYTYIFGRQRILPVFIYNHSITKKFGVEAALPANAKMRYALNPKTLFYFGYELEGANYQLQFTDPLLLTDKKSLQLRRSVVKLALEFEREIYDFFWIGLALGMQQPVSLNVTDVKTGGLFGGADHLVRNKLNLAPFANASIFLVIPRRFDKDIKNTD
ncbi:MAG TPA: DUF6268 family outer membrane beta-barrel protein [Cytophagaceae bacterium]|jgi:hypothetical protein